jgi:predicted AlkP superfamily phosphohydrolase/phosphomutase
VHPWEFCYRDDFSYEEKGSYRSDVVQQNTLYNDLPLRGQRVGLVNMPGVDKSFTIPGGFVIPFTSSIHQEDDAPVLDAIKKIDSDCISSVATLYHKYSCDFVAAFVTGYAQLLDSVYRLEAQKQSVNDQKHLEDVRGYYKFLDAQIGELIGECDADTALLVLSTYGLSRLRARININEILVDQGDLCLRKRPRSLSAFANLDVDWKKTRCWSTGFNGSLFINLKGREPMGTVDAKDYEKTLAYLTTLTGSIQAGQRDTTPSHAWTRNDLYYDLEAASGPDLFLTFKDIATSELISHKADTELSHHLAPEGFNAASGTSGCFFLYRLADPFTGDLGEVAVEDFAPTIFELLDILHNKYMRGKSILSSLKSDKTKDKQTESTLFQSRLETLAKEERAVGDAQKDEEKIRSRLDALGY